MIELPESIKQAVRSFSKLPGVGEKTALRQVMSMIAWGPSELGDFSESMRGLVEVKRCNECGLYSDDDVCEICLSESRKSESTLCVVENISDLLAIERSGTFHGIYHVLGGVLNPLMGIGPDELKLDKLKDRVTKYNISTLILAVNPSVEGDATCSYINQLLQGVHVERIGFGIPMGGSLEYLDPLTITKALENRKRI